MRAHLGIGRQLGLSERLVDQAFAAPSVRVPDKSGQRVSPFSADYRHRSAPARGSRDPAPWPDFLGFFFHSRMIEKERELVRISLFQAGYRLARAFSNSPAFQRQNAISKLFARSVGSHSALFIGVSCREPIGAGLVLSIQFFAIIRLRSPTNQKPWRRNPLRSSGCLASSSERSIALAKSGAPGFVLFRVFMKLRELRVPIHGVRRFRKLGNRLIKRVICCSAGALSLSSASISARCQNSRLAWVPAKSFAASELFPRFSRMTPARSAASRSPAAALRLKLGQSGAFRAFHAIIHFRQKILERPEANDA